MAIKTAPEYVSVEDFKTYTGIDLNEELPIGKSPEIFLRDAEDHLIQFVNIQSWRPITKYIYDNVYSEAQMDKWREAILTQAKYEFYNSDINMNSGVDPLEGLKLSPEDREAASISPDAIKKLKMAGILVYKMVTRF